MGLLRPLSEFEAKLEYQILPRYNKKRSRGADLDGINHDALWRLLRGSFIELFCCRA
ncbi:hypothetical protein HMPREF1990_00001, partial [Porphyromonas gingivalis W4087]